MKVLLTIFLVGLLFVAVAPEARAGSVLDQSFDPASTGYTAFVGQSNLVDWSQTFTVGLTGKLTEVQVKIQRAQAATDPLLFDIRKTALGVPVASDSGSDILASVSVAAAAVPSTAGFFSIDSLDVSVTSGDVLAIVLRSDDAVSGAYQWKGNSGGGYSGGQALSRVGSNAWSPKVYDLAFKTYVNAVPLPAAGWMGLGLLGLLGAFRARRRR